MFTMLGRQAKRLCTQRSQWFVRLPAVNLRSVQKRTLLDLQVQYVECIATGRCHGGQPGSLTLTGQVRRLHMLCKQNWQHAVASSTRNVCQRQGSRQQVRQQLI